MGVVVGILLGSPMNFPKLLKILATAGIAVELVSQGGGSVTMNTHSFWRW